MWLCGPPHGRHLWFCAIYSDGPLYRSKSAEARGHAPQEAPALSIGSCSPTIPIASALHVGAMPTTTLSWLGFVLSTQSVEFGLGFVRFNRPLVK